jgi:fatty-acyl-CoA synthase/long-chain acyl-CoA synthetase
MLSHEAVTRGPTERARHRLATGGHDVHWGAGPLFHIGTLSPFIGTIGAIGTYLTDTVFEPGRALELMTSEKVTTAWPWFQAIMLGLIDHPSFDADKLKSLRSMFLISPSVLVDRVQTLLPSTEIIQGCGMTETAGIFALADRDESREQRSTTQGKAATGVEVRILSLDGGRDALPGEVGEILVRGYCVMDGYYRDPVKTAEALDEDGWLHTGDLYSKSADGSLVFNGRLKDMLKVGGENVAAIEVEAFLCEHPAVNLSAVIGMADDRLEEVPVAFVELRRGNSLEAAELIEFCKGRIANYKIPRAVYFVQPEEWPMSATKIQKQALKVRLQEILGK